MNNLRLALRLLSKSPGFTALVVLVLALGIGANTAMFTLIERACLRRLPYPDPDQLVHVTEYSERYSNMSVSYPDFQDWRSGQSAFSGLAIYRIDDVKLKTPGGAEQVTVAEVSQDFFRVLGLHASLGRGLQPDDDRVGAAPVVWLTHASWQRYFRGQPQLVGGTVVLDGIATTVAGILPADFRFYRDADAYVPIEPIVDRQFMRIRANHNGTEVVGRVRPGVSIGTAQAQLSAIGERLEHRFPQSNSGVRVRTVPLRQELEGDSTTGLYLLLGAVGTVLLIACVNIANMLLARSFSRSREMAIRTALGATRKNLVGQLLTESSLLAVAGGLLGAWLGHYGYAIVERLAPWEMRELMQSGGPDYLVWVFIAGLVLLTGVGFGLAPAWQLSHSNPNDALKNTRRTVRTLFGRFHLPDALVLVQVSLAVMLLVGAGLMIRSLERLTSVATGLRPEHVVTLRVATPPDSEMVRDPMAFIRFNELLAQKVQTLTGVRSAAMASSLPYTWNTSSNMFYRPDRPLPEPGKYPVANFHTVTPGYFQTMGIPLLRGALFDGRERPAPIPPGKPVTMASLPSIYSGFTVSTVINRKMAEKYWPGEDPIGKTFRLGQPEMHFPEMKIIGIVGNTTQTGAERGEPIEYYTPLSQWPGAMILHLAVRAQGDPSAIVSSLRHAIHEYAPDEPIFDVKLMTERISDFSSDRRFEMVLFTFFAGTALLLAGVGIYGVLACIVGQRTRDIGIRMALGARRSQVLRHVIRRGMAVVVPGVAIGLVVAWSGSRVLQSQLFGITVADLPPYLVGGFLLLMAALFACAIPAHRASRVNPVEALRAE